MKESNPDRSDYLISDERPRIWRYSHSAGPARSRFLLELRDGPRIVGNRCSACRRTYVPSRLTCHVCFEQMTEWVEVGEEGTLETFTVTSAQASPDGQSQAFGIIRLDGADTGFVHRLGGASPDSFRTGMRVRAVFAAERAGDIRDIEHFEPVA